MSNKHLPRPAAPSAPAVDFKPNRFDAIALKGIMDGVPDATGKPFLTSEGAIRLALGVSYRVLSAGRMAEFRGPLCAVGGKDPAL